MLNEKILNILVCPACHSQLDYNGEVLRCSVCHVTYLVDSGIPILLSKTRG